MAQAIAEAMADLDTLVVEAGTGTGKTFAYLLPALLGGRKTIISTGTKALQDQLYHRDLPLVGRAIGRPVTTALLKGRANYLCLQRLDQLVEPARSLRADVAAIRRWKSRTDTGDRAEMTEVAEDSVIWPLVTSTSENCLGQKCPFHAECHVVRARRAAQEADLVVVNHYLLLADLAMKEVGFVEFLPGAEAIIIDEAHQLPDLAIQFFGLSVGSRELQQLAEESRAATLGRNEPGLNAALDALDTAIRVLRAEAPRERGRHDLRQAEARLATPLSQLRAALDDAAAALIAADDEPALEQLQGQLVDASARLALLADDDAWDGLRWLDVGARGLRLNLTPLDVSGNLGPLIGNAGQAWIFTSATLAVGEDFSHFTSRLGIDGAAGVTFPSPFPLAERGLVYLPDGLPAPSDRGHTDALLDATAPLLDVTAGGVFFLFTSYRALNAARDWFAADPARCRQRSILVQGDSPRDDLLRRFRSAGNAILLGTGSFWEGVDVRGAALTAVVIDKLPFTSPADPLLMARLEFLRRRGSNGFMEHQVPQAVIALKQGAGRLLRDHGDYGVVAIGDPRVTGKRYGRFFLDSLAPMPVTTSQADVEAFYTRFETQRKRA